MSKATSGGSNQSSSSNGGQGGGQGDRRGNNGNGNNGNGNNGGTSTATATAVAAHEVSSSSSSAAATHGSESVSTVMNVQQSDMSALQQNAAFDKATEHKEKTAEKSAEKSMATATVAPATSQLQQAAAQLAAAARADKSNNDANNNSNNNNNTPAAQASEESSASAPKTSEKESSTEKSDAAPSSSAKATSNEPTFVAPEKNTPTPEASKPAPEKSQTKNLDDNVTQKSITTSTAPQKETVGSAVAVSTLAAAIATTAASPSPVAAPTVKANDAAIITSAPPQKAITEDTTPHSVGGVIKFMDVDIDDHHSVSVISAPQDGNGTLTPVVSTDSFGTRFGEVVWTYTANSQTLQSLAAGQTRTETFTVQVNDGHGGTVSQNVTITLTGTNDAPTITGGSNTASITEDTTPHSATGNITFADVDLTDTHSVSVSNAPNAGDGTLTPVVNGHSVDWNYTANPQTLQSLAAGQTRTETFTVQVNDGHGGTVSQNVTITLTGTNDTPTVVSSTATTATSGEVVFADADKTDTHTVTQTNVGNVTGTFTVDKVQNAPNNGQNGSGGRATYNYTANSSTYNALAANQTLTETVALIISDGHGGTTTQNVSATVVGVNDGPVLNNIAAQDTLHGVAGGNAAFSDLDLNDTHTSSVTSTPAVGDGTLTVTVGADSTGTGDGHLTWSYHANMDTLNDLAEGETRTEQFVVMVTDNNGATAAKTISVTLTGGNDDVTLSIGSNNSASATLNLGSASHTLSGTITIEDLDTTDIHTVTSVTAANLDALGGITTVVNGHQLTWQYTLDESSAYHALAAGETATETYTLQVSDGHGSTAVQEITITLQGTNAAPVVSNTQVYSPYAGVVNFTDANAIDTHTVTQSNVGAVTGTFNLTLNESTNGGAGAVYYTYTANNATLTALGAGETRTETVHVTVADGHGGSVSQNISATITGTNDAVVLGAHTATSATAGTVAFTDADTTDTHTATSSTLNGTGTFTATLNETTHEVSYTYVATAATAQKLSTLPTGNTLNEVYSITIDDGHGGLVTKDVTITLNSNNHAAVITGTVMSSSTSGIVNFADADVTDAHTLTVTSADGNTGTLNTTLDAATGGTLGSVHYQYTPNAGTLASLGAGETRTETFTLTLNDGHGGLTYQDVDVTIVGTNDAPIITIGSGNSIAGTSSGTLTVADADTNDTLTSSASSSSANPCGTLSTAITDGVLTWTYSLNSDSASYKALADGETQVDSFLVAVSDGHGGTAMQQVLVTVTGTNDAPVVTNTSATSATSGTISFTDADAIDSPTVTVANVGTPTGSLDALLADDGTVAWQYTPNAATLSSLTAGQTLTENFTVSINDGHGGVVTQNIPVTITGVNSAPVSSTVALTNTTGTVTFTDADAGDTFTITQANVGSVTGTFALTNNNGVISYTYTAGADLAAGESRLESVNVTVADNHGGSTTQTITALATGVNDAPITSATTVLTATTGVVNFTDADLTDTHTITQANNGSVTGVFNVELTHDTTGSGTGGAINYTYVPNAATVASLAAGQTITESQNITITDNNGASVVKTISVTLTGTNDGPVITAAPLNSITTGNTSVFNYAKTGSVNFADADVLDTHTVTQVNNGTVTGTFALTVNDSTGTGAGSVSYTYTANEATLLSMAADEVRTESIDVTINDGHGGTATQTITVTLAPNMLIGGSGNDTIGAGTGYQGVTAGDGDDWISGRGNLYGGDGNDTIFFTRNGWDQPTNNIDGGNGIDSLDAYWTETAEVIDLAAGTLTTNGVTYSVTNMENATGSLYAADVLLGTSDANVLHGGDGNFNDTLDGRGGADVLSGADGNDLLIGGAGSDSLDGGTGADTADYTGSDAAVTVNLTTNVNTGGHAEGDYLVNIENITGSAFADNLTGNTNTNVLAGGAGADTMDGGAGSDTADYSASDAAVTVDLITNVNTGGHAQGDLLSNIENIMGSSYDDSLTGDTSNNLLSSGAGNDVLVGGAGADTLDGGSGNDTASYSTSNAAVTINLTTNINTGGHAQGDSLSSIENVTGSSYADNITGNSLNNIITGGAGADILNGGDGADTFMWTNGHGNDVIDGGAGASWLDVVQLQTPNMTYGSDWTVNVTHGSISVDTANHQIDLGTDAAGTITIASTGEVITFNNLEMIKWA